VRRCISPRVYNWPMRAGRSTLSHSCKGYFTGVADYVVEIETVGFLADRSGSDLRSSRICV
jgi:hypothetical protein